MYGRRPPPSKRHSQIKKGGFGFQSFSAPTHSSNDDNNNNNISLGNTSPSNQSNPLSPNSNNNNNNNEKKSSGLNSLLLAPEPLIDDYSASSDDDRQNLRNNNQLSINIITMETSTVSKCTNGSSASSNIRRDSGVSSGSRKLELDLSETSGFSPSYNSSIQEVNIDEPDNIEDVSRLIAMPARFIARRHSASSSRKNSTSVNSTRPIMKRSSRSMQSYDLSNCNPEIYKIESDPSDMHLGNIKKPSWGNNNLKNHNNNEEDNMNYDNITDDNYTFKKCHRDGCKNIEKSVHEFKYCKNCKKVVYCSIMCQDIHYDIVHKRVCNNNNNNNNNNNDNEGKINIPPSSIRLVLFDFDRTIINKHSGGYYKGAINDLVQHVTRAFIPILETMLDHHFHVGIVSFADEVGKSLQDGMGGERLIKAIIEGALHEKYKDINIVKNIVSRIYIVAANPSIRNKLKEHHNNQLPNSKEWHINKIKQKVNLIKGEMLMNEEIMLFDDSKTNISHAKRQKIKAFVVDRHTGLTLECWNNAVDQC